MNLSELDKRLSRIEFLLQRLVVPVEAEEARQLAGASDEQRTAHNRTILERVKARQPGRLVT